MNTKVIFLCCALAAFVSLSAAVDCENPPKPLDNWRACCPTPDFFGEELKTKCKEVAHTDSDPNKHKYKHPLLHNVEFIKCVFKEGGLIQDKKVNEPKLKEHLSVVMKDSPDMIPVFEQSFKTCAAKYEEYKKQHDEHHKAKRHAKLHPVTRILGCLLKESFVNCAPSVWTGAADCNAWRDVLKTCENPGKYWHKFHHDGSSSEEA